MLFFGGFTEIAVCIVGTFLVANVGNSFYFLRVRVKCVCVFKVCRSTDFPVGKS